MQLLEPYQPINYEHVTLHLLQADGVTRLPPYFHRNFPNVSNIPIQIATFLCQASIFSSLAHFRALPPVYTTHCYMDRFFFSRYKFNPLYFHWDFPAVATHSPTDQLVGLTSPSATFVAGSAPAFGTLNHTAPWRCLKHTASLFVPRLFPSFSSTPFVSATVSLSCF